MHSREMALCFSGRQNPSGDVRPLDAEPGFEP
jgi:hypothetical protein